MWRCHHRPPAVANWVGVTPDRDPRCLPSLGIFAFVQLAPLIGLRPHSRFIWVCNLRGPRYLRYPSFRSRNPRSRWYRILIQRSREFDHIDGLQQAVIRVCVGQGQRGCIAQVEAPVKLSSASRSA